MFSELDMIVFFSSVASLDVEECYERFLTDEPAEDPLVRVYDYFYILLNVFANISLCVL